MSKKVTKTTVTKTTTTKTTKVAEEDPSLKGKTTSEVYEIKEAFNLFDTDKSGTIDVQEFKDALNNLGLDDNNGAFVQLLDNIDANKSGKVDFDEFVNLLTVHGSDLSTKEDLERVYTYFLGDDKGDKIDINHLRDVCELLGEKLSDEELEEMIFRADVDKDGKVSFDEYYNIMTYKI
jgi:Ca2+-binding EF-hand superfamily protein